MSTGSAIPSAAGRLILAGVPLGNPADASARLIEALSTAAVIAAEDTRRLHRLCRDLEVAPAGRVVSFFDGNEAGRVPQLIAALREGRDVLVVTDAGMPSVSDPGYRLVAAAAAEGLAVTVLPGPSAVLAALAVSGLPVDRFCFEGFLPRRGAERRRRVAELAAEARTLVLFESPRRLSETLRDLAAALGDQRRAAVCRELTKTHEQVLRGTLGELADWAAGEVLGEITLVIAGARPVASQSADPGALVAAVAAVEAGGGTRKEATAEVADRFGVPKRAVFDALVAAKQGGRTGSGGEHAKAGNGAH